ncbi:N-acetylmuramoyl-L-alanine amidase [Bacillus sp. FJAT-45350]|uniref:N-acetylmuramoyl-L-alanine amidase n=1 Tax=Bacillus sp. FJAT-45350 TaxID=2011014 RepID=UPI000BB845A4|nr:N-acetylmuramoyl-L-alanine amidase [Bacillus sp. FJAT-45350]
MGKESLPIKIVVVIALAFAIFSAVSTTFAMTTGAVTTNILNIRSEADINSTKVGSLKKGEIVTIHETVGEWYKISFDSITGYVHTDYIKLQQYTKEDDNTQEDVTVYVNDVEVELPFDTLPIVDNHILIPFRAIGEALEIDVTWNPDTRQVFANEFETNVVFTIGDISTVINNQVINIKPAPTIVHERTVIPLRFFSETFGAEVKWDETTREVHIQRRVTEVTEETSVVVPEQEVSGVYFGEVRSDTLNVRQGPSVEFESKGQLQKGENIEIINFDNQWAEIRYHDKVGYVHSYYLHLYNDKGLTSILGEPLLVFDDNRTVITWPKIGGKVETQHRILGNRIEIITDAKEVLTLEKNVNGIENIEYIKDESTDTITILMDVEGHVSLKHSDGELELSLSPNGLKGKRIMIDAGHGGSDPGAVANGLKEKEIILDLSKRVQKLLEAEGADVIMARTTDMFLTLAERVEIAKKEKVDSFISIHANAASNVMAHGTETYWDSTFAAGRSETLAENIQNSLIDTLKTNDRGVKEGQFYVIKNTPMPSVLVELGFMTNEEEAKELASEEFRQNAAAALLDGIKKYYH